MDKQMKSRLIVFIVMLVVLAGISLFLVYRDNTPSLEPSSSPSSLEEEQHKVINTYEKTSYLDPNEDVIGIFIPFECYYIGGKYLEFYVEADDYVDVYFINQRYYPEKEKGKIIYYDSYNKVLSLHVTKDLRANYTNDDSVILIQLSDENKDKKVNYFVSMTCLT